MSFIREKTFIKSKSSGSGTVTVHVPRRIHYQALQFLLDNIQADDSMDTLDKTNSDQGAPNQILVSSQVRKLAYMLITNMSNLILSGKLH